MARSIGRRNLAIGLALALLMVATAGCASTTVQNAALAFTPTPSVNPLTRIHNVTAARIPLFVRVTFSPTTSYDQAVAILNADPYPSQPYPWTCDDPRSPTPPPLAERRATFAATHSLLLSYAGWDQLTRIVASDSVISVDAAPIYPCP